MQSRRDSSRVAAPGAVRYETGREVALAYRLDGKFSTETCRFQTSGRKWNPLGFPMRHGGELAMGRLPTSGCRLHDLLLGGICDGEFCGLATFAQDHDPIAQGEQFRQFAARYDDPEALAA